MTRTRRRLVAAAGAALLGGAMPCLGQARAVKRVAMLVPVTSPENTRTNRAYWAKALAGHGFREGENLEILWFEFPHDSSWTETLPPIVERMVRSAPHCISVAFERFTEFVQRATRTIPIVTLVFEGDPVDLGFARTLASPGGNITGLHSGAAEKNAKRLEMLRSIHPGLSCVGWIAFEPQLLWFPTFERVARAAQLDVHKIVLDWPRLDNAASAIERLRRDGCLAAHFHSSVPKVVSHVTALARRHRIALSYGGDDEHVRTDGILFKYDALFQSAGYQNSGRSASIIARVLRGEAPGRIPFEGPAAYRLQLNLKTAATLGVTVPAQMRLLADEVIQ